MNFHDEFKKVFYTDTITSQKDFEHFIYHTLFLGSLCLKMLREGYNFIEVYYFYVHFISFITYISNTSEIETSAEFNEIYGIVEKIVFCNTGRKKGIVKKDFIISLKEIEKVCVRYIINFSN